MFIGITAFESKENVLAQLESLYSQKNIYYIHYNKRNVLKYPFQYLDLKKTIKSKYKNVHVFTKYRVYWGDFSIVKSVLNLQKIFLKTNEEIFLHLDQKTINVFPINEIENKLKNWFSSGYNFFDFNSLALKAIGQFKLNKINKYNEKYSDFYPYRNWNKKTCSLNSKYSKFWKLINLITQVLFDFNFLKNFLKKLNLKSSYQKFLENNHSYREIFSVGGDGILSKKNSKDLKFKDFEFKTFCICSSFVCMNKKDIQTITFNCSKHKMIKSLFRYSKKKYVPDDYYFPTLYWNLISKDVSKSKSILYHKNITNINDYIDFLNVKLNDTLFCRRTIGSENIKYFNNTKIN